MKLEDYKKSSCFTTPDGYFEELNEKIKRATCGKERHKTKSMFYTRIIGYAAMVAVVFFIAANLIFDRAGNTAETMAGQVSMPGTAEAFDDSEFIEKMLTEYPIDEYTFYCYMTDTDNNH